MPGGRGSLTESDVRAYVREHCFTGSPDERVGIELERLTIRLDTPESPLEFDAITSAVASAGPLPGGSSVTFEPGGQVELSGPPQSLARACDDLSDDLLAVDGALRDHGLGLVALGIDPLRPPRNINPKPRYRAMADYFGAAQPAGHVMMCSTAAVQINVDLGPRDEGDERWHVAHALGPVLAATFANSPILEGPHAGSRSARAAVWGALDPTRTRAADHLGNPADDWTDYALDARVMFMTEPGGDVLIRPARPLTFREWLAPGRARRGPDLLDLEVHLTTLFPPVRPRGWLELRMIDTLPSPWWRVAAAVSAALLTDLTAGAKAARAGRDLPWAQAAGGTSDPRFASAARVLMACALEALEGGDAGGRDLVAEYAERWTWRDRCPADDRLDAWRRGAPLLDPDADLLGAG